MFSINRFAQYSETKSKGGSRQGRQRRRWDDIREWTGLELAKSQRAVENRGKWRKLVAKSSVVPQRPSRLRIDEDDEADGAGVWMNFVLA